MAAASQSYRRIYVIGDIHGRADLLDDMARLIRDDLGGAGDDCLTVTLGDYIDRGPDSRGVLDRLVRNPFPTPYVGLKGNHEDLFLSFLIDPAIGPHLRALGGLETLKSYGLPVGPLRKATGTDLEQSYQMVSKVLPKAIPREHVEFLLDLKSSLTVDRYFLCHAGIRPGVPFDQQSDEDLFWIRDEFLGSTVDHGKLVIHGHTPTEEPEVRPNRINIDTGACITGRLTCLAIEGENRRFLST